MRFGNIEGLNSGAAAASGSHEVQKSVRQFANSPLLPLLYGFAGNQFASDAECRRSRQNETDRRLLIHASSGDQWDPRKGPLESANVAVAANLRAWKHLDEIRSGFPRRYDFSGRKGTGYHRQVLCFANSTISRSSPGLVRKATPASTQRRAVSRSSTV